MKKWYKNFASLQALILVKNFSLKIKHIFSLSIIFLGFTLNLFGQTFQLSISFNDSIEKHAILKKLKYKKNFNSIVERDAEIKQVFFSLQERGFLTLTEDSSRLDSIKQHLYLTIGNAYKWAVLKKGNVKEEILNAVGFREKFYFNHEFSPSETARLLERILSYEENNGYPFAALKLDSLKIEDTKIYACLNLTKAQLCLIFPPLFYPFHRYPKRCLYLPFLSL